MRAGLLAALGLAACSPQSGNESEPAPAATQSPAGAAAPANGQGLTGQVSGLSADSSGLAVTTSDTQLIVDLPADMLFAFDKADLAPEAATNLAKVADLVRQAPAGTIQVVGHTDAKGDDAYNLGLSEQRAQSVVNWMREQVGVRQRQFEVIGKGKTEPVAPNLTAEGKDDAVGRAKNRRVVVAIPR